MKKSEILAVLKANKKITDYELNIVHKDSRELFYVLHHLEINRAVKIESVSIKVYVSDKKTTGSSSIVVTAADNKKTLNEKLNKAVIKAKQAKNAYYPLAEKTKNIKDTIKDKKDLNKIASEVAKAVFKADKYRNGWINSTEIFVSQYQREFINSRGIDHTSNSFSIEIECIPTWSNKKEEFELYKFYRSGKIDYKQITKEVDEILNLAKDRSNAKTLKEVKLPKDIKVLVKNDMRDVIVDNLAGEMRYHNLYMKQNHYNKGDLISNNKFDLTMKASIKGCVASSKYDRSGVVLKSKNIIKNGVANNTYGDIQFGYYLNTKNITGMLPVCELKGETASYKKDKHLIIETFSAPQLESDSGYWGGEVRLARYYDGKKYIPLTGFSIAGNIYNDIKDVKFSKETDNSDFYYGPKYFIFKNIDINQSIYLIKPSVPDGFYIMKKFS